MIHAELVHIHAFIPPVIREGSRIRVTRARRLLTPVSESAQGSFWRTGDTEAISELGLALRRTLGTKPPARTVPQ